MIALSQEKNDEFLKDYSDWRHEDDALKAEFKFKDFTEAWAFLSKVALITEKHDHHAEIHNVYNRVTLTLTTHDAGNKVTQKDLDIVIGINK